MEVLVSILILALIAGPLVTLLTVALQEYLEAWQRTQAVYAVQSLLEPLLAPLPDAVSGTEDFCPHPSLPQYEYRIIVKPYLGPALDSIVLELREKGHQEASMVLTTLKARRRSYALDQE